METDFKERNELYEATLRKLGEYLKDQMAPGMGFALLLFNNGPGGNMFYLSTARRTDMIKAMQEFILKNS